ncbi:MAG: TetR/AcrR family transcriptional regulator [Nocardioides sp.]|nr:TetR/AcrR family transcriptional regulator [Nocardioides sp.]
MGAVNIVYRRGVSAPRYHHGNLREALAEAAVEAAREHGPDGLAVRDLARRVGVSHNAAYRHFADRDALVAVVAERAMGDLVAAMHRRLDAVEESDPSLRARRRLMAIGAGYVDFAVAEPGLFRLLFTAYPEVPGTDGVDEDTEDPDDPFGMLNAALDDLVDVGHVHPSVRPGAEIGCWSAVHGFAVLNTEGPLRGLDPADREAALRAMLERLDVGYGVRPG